MNNKDVQLNRLNHMLHEAKDIDGLAKHRFELRKIIDSTKHGLTCNSAVIDNLEWTHEKLLKNHKESKPEPESHIWTPKYTSV